MQKLRQELNKCKMQLLDVNSSTLQKETSIKYIDVDLDQELFNKIDMKRRCKTAM